MSDATKAAIEDAVRAHIAAESSGDYLMGWAIVAVSAIPEAADGHAYWYENADQPIHHTLGLIDMARSHYHANLVEEDE